MSKSIFLVGANSAALILSGMLLSVPLAGWAQMEEIVVSTRRKTESVQDVPIAVDVVSSEQIARQGITDVADISQLSPSVQFDSSFGPADTRIAVRGLSNTRGRSNVAFLVDNVDTTTENFVSAGSGLLTNQRLLVDVERVEIVKGPQSALFGRAAFAGAISYTTKDPSDEFEGDVTLSVGDYGLFELGGAISGPVQGLEDVLGFRISGAYWNEDGAYDNAITGGNLGGEDGWGTAVTALWTPVDEVRVKWRTEYSDSNYGQRPAVRIGGGTDGRNQQFYPYPVNPTVIQGNTGSTNLADFGQYGGVDETGQIRPVQQCSPGIRGVYDPATGQGQGLAPGEDCLGIWQPAGFGGAGNLQPTLSEDPSTGKDYQGTNTQLLRTTINASIDYDFGTFSSITGWTDYNAFDELDQDYQAELRPRMVNGRLYLDGLNSHQLGRSDLETKQFSQELRFASNLEGPVQFTVGTLFWHEDRRQDDLNYIIACIQNTKKGDGIVWPDPETFVPGQCDGALGSVSNWQDRALDMFPCQYTNELDANGNPVPLVDEATGKCVRAPRTAAPWQAVTEHKSVYFKIEWDLSDTWTVEFENRTIWEDFDLTRTNKSSCTNLAAPQVNTALDAELPVADPNWYDVACESEYWLNPNIPISGLAAGLGGPPESLTVTNPNGQWALVEGTEKTNFNTPKVTVRWQTSDTIQTYFSWGIGKKPGGISALAGGGSSTSIDDQRFEPEEVQAWEVGQKTDLDLFGDLRFNYALFFNDYTAKQIGTQVVDDSGTLQPTIINVDAAEVWGLELEATWFPEMIEGLMISGSYTYLKAEYTDFIDRTRSLIRASFSGECFVVTIIQNNIPRSFCDVDLSGNKLERTPEHAAVGNVSYTRQFMDTDSDWFWELTGVYQDERFIDADNAAKFDSYLIFDTRLGLTNENWEFLIFVDNIFEDDTIQTGGNGPDFGRQVGQLGFTGGLGVSHYFGVLPDPRKFGARLTVRF